MTRFLGFITIVLIFLLLSPAHSDRVLAQETTLECAAALNDIDVLPDGTSRVGVRSDEAINFFRDDPGRGT